MDGIECDPTPETAEEQWKSHRLLQWCYEQLAKFASIGTLTCYRDGLAVTMKLSIGDDIDCVQGRGHDICGAIAILNNNLKAYNENIASERSS